MQTAFEIVVIGSINLDLVLRVAHPPLPGETVLARDLSAIPGGKGANQAVGAARLGARTAMVGRVGDDEFGRRLLAGLGENRVDAQHVQITGGVASGVAVITVDDRGQNAICVAPGANHRVTPADVDAAADTIKQAKVCLLQLELPIDTVLHAIEVCRAAGVETILDPAPAPTSIPEHLLEVDILTPNLIEARTLAAANTAEDRELAAALAARGARRVVIKLGDQGALVCDGDRFRHLQAHRITPVDTTAAGDAFNAALGVARARGQALPDAIRTANAAGAAACLKFGAQPSLPTQADIDAVLRESSRSS